jgi:hypothetical protein
MKSFPCSAGSIFHGWDEVKTLQALIFLYKTICSQCSPWSIWTLSFDCLAGLQSPTEIVFLAAQRANVSF